MAELVITKETIASLSSNEQQCFRAGEDTVPQGETGAIVCLNYTRVDPCITLWQCITYDVGLCFTNYGYCP